MAIIKANTDEFKKIIDDFDSCVKNYNQAIESFFKTIEDSRGIAWEGDAAKEYYDKAQIDKLVYTDFGDELNIFSSTLSDTCVSLNDTIRKSSRV